MNKSQVLLEKETELKDCPWCKEKPEVLEIRHHFNSTSKGSYSESGGWYVECETCNYQLGHNQDYGYWGDATANFSSKKEAVTFFNKGLE